MTGSPVSVGSVDALTMFAPSERIMKGLVSLVPPTLRDKVAEQLVAVPVHMAAGHRLLAIMNLRGGLMALGINLCAAVSRQRSENQACRAPGMIWQYLERAGVLAPYERVLIDAAYGFVESLEVEAIRADDASVRTASSVTAAAIQLLAERARTMNLA